MYTQYLNNKYRCPAVHTLFYIDKRRGPFTYTQSFCFKKPGKRNDKIDFLRPYVTDVIAFECS